MSVDLISVLMMAITVSFKEGVGRNLELSGSGQIFYYSERSDTNYFCPDNPARYLAGYQTGLNLFYKITIIWCNISQS